MRKNLLLSLFIFVSVFSGCTSGKDLTGVWVNKEKAQGKTFGSLFIIVMTADIQARVKLEKDLAAIAEARGFKAVKSIDVMAPSLSDPKTPTKEEVVSKVKASGCEGVFVSALLKKDENVRYVPGSTAYTVMPNYSWSGNYFVFTVIGPRLFPRMGMSIIRKAISC